jgi:hypothetical protein
LGNEAATGRYEIVLTAAPVGSPANQAFTEWLTIGCRTGTYQGFDVLPKGLMELDTVTVEIQP